MEKKTLTLTIIFLISIFMFNSKVYANKVAWIGCDNIEMHIKLADRSLEITTNGALAYIGGDYNYAFLSDKILETEKGTVKTFNYLGNTYTISFGILHFTGCWFKDAEDYNKSCSKDELKFSEKEVKEMLNSGSYCPKVMRTSKNILKPTVLVFAGTTQPTKTSEFSTQYKFTKANSGDQIIAEGYTKNGEHILYSNGKSSGDEKGHAHLSYLYAVKYKDKFPDISKIKSQNTSFDNEANVTRIFDSGDDIQPLYNKIDDWYNKYGDNASINNLVMDNKNLVSSCENINNNINSNNEMVNPSTAASVLNNLKTFLPKFKEEYNKVSTNGYPMCVKNEKTANAVNSAYNCAIQDLLGNIDYVPKEIQAYVYNDVEEYLQNKGLSTVDYKEVLSTLTYCAVNLDKNAEALDLNQNETSSIRQEYEDFSNSAGIVLVYDCKSLIGDNLAKKIEKYFNIIKIAIPIMLIALGIVDFAQAVFAGDEEKMKKAQKTFIRRIIASVLIFLTPILVKLLLLLANEVWSNISADGCGIF